MSLALLILAHKNPHQVARLFRAVYRPVDVVVLHFDRRSSRELHQLGANLARAHPNVVVLPSRTVLWGGYEMAAAQIDAMAAALRVRSDWHHFINLTGQDFPLQSTDAIDARLAAEPEANYVSWFDPMTSTFWSNARQRILRYHLEWPWLDRLLRVPGFGRRLRALLGWRNRLPHLPGFERKWPDFHYYGGSNHVILSRAACQHVVSDPQALRIRRWLKHAGHANEIVFPSVMLNSPLAHTVVNTDLREIDFPLHAPHPRTFTSRDWDRLNASPMLIARKFDEAVDGAILDRLAARLPGITRSQPEPAHS
ncbi:glycosyl transferase [Opitutus terrae]|uniref:Peptide O-xylosyltransferase n=1 Tax=Opitutus terrae (strain DSM 11246 / JCM 15787 / PB90-1) TaxID=452637 RepID=B1ZT74_OPITP|nr:glycosyl transferase [Opitutus terrae]ACB76528.1 glycosyl transferase family 14 [Opitutus terrae PB90-1]